MSASKWKPYPSYKESVERKSMQIPSHWEMIPNRHLMKLRNQKVGEDWSSTDLLSLTLQGIILRDIDSGVGKYPASFETYQIVEIDDLVFCLFDVAETPRTIGISQQRGMITGAYDVLTCVDGVSPNFVHDYYLAIDFIKGLEPYYTGLRNVVRTDTFNQMKTPIPPLDEQLKITKFIKNIDFLTTSLQRILKERAKLLEEKRSALITQLVTKGFNSDVSMKYSGIDWIGDIPEHWNSKKVKFVSKIFRGKFGHRPRNDPKLYNGQYPFVQTGNVARANKFLTDYDQTLNELGRSVSEEFPAGTIVMAIAANIGDVAILTFDACFPDSIVGFNPNQNMNQEYLYYSLRALASELDKVASQSTQQNLNIELVGNLVIPVPPEKEQIAISKYISEVEQNSMQSTEKIEKLISQVKEYRSALISAAVTGKIDVRESV